MYGEGNVAPIAPVVAGVAVTALPNTGANDLVQIAVAVGAAMVTWGVLYLYQMRTSA